MLATLLASIASGEALDALKRLRLTAILYAIAGLSGLCGIGFLIGAGFIAAADRWGTFEASIGFGIGFITLACLILLVQKLVSSAQAKRAARRRSLDATALAGTAAIALLPALLARKGALGALGLPLLGVLGYAIYRENRKPRQPLKRDPE